MEYVLGHEKHLNTFKIIEIIHCMPSEHNRINLEIKYRNTAGKYQNTWRVKSILLNNTWIEEEISRI